MKKEKKPFICDFCHKPMIHGHELIINDKFWEELCDRAGSPRQPKDTLLCPECIESLAGRPLTIYDLIIRWKLGRGCTGAVPMNLWYYRQEGMMKEAEPYIRAHIRCHRFAAEAWKKRGIVLVK